MEELEKQQLEALEVAGNYCKKLTKGIETIMNEFNGAKQPDTDEYLKHIIAGINWTIEIFNRTQNLVNKNSEMIDKQSINQSVLTLNDAINAKDDKRIASGLNELLIFVKKFEEATQKICK